MAIIKDHQIKGITYLDVSQNRLSGKYDALIYVVLEWWAGFPYKSWRSTGHGATEAEAIQNAKDTWLLDGMPVEGIGRSFDFDYQLNQWGDV